MLESNFAASLVAFQVVLYLNFFRGKLEVDATGNVYTGYNVVFKL